MKLKINRDSPRFVGLAWNEKHLDYEIETYRANTYYVFDVRVTWNEKHLDYEIETCEDFADRISQGTWNEKHLDYEIETVSQTKVIM